jgi:heat shock protein HtpX
MNNEQLQVHKLRNSLQTGFRIATLAALLASLAWLVGGVALAWGALAGVVILAVGYPAARPRFLMSLYGARRIRQDEAPGLYAILDALSGRAGLDRPPVLYLLPTRLMNAFTSGSGQDAAIAISDGLLRRMELRELAAVLANGLARSAKRLPYGRMVRGPQTGGRVRGCREIRGLIGG